MNLQVTHVSWVDLLVVIVLLWGIKQGQKRGMSEEVLVLGQWVMILAVAGLGYAPLGQLLAQTGLVGLLWARVICYLGLAILVKMAFSGVRKSVGEKLVESEMFGRGEYYLGMLAGGARYLCVLVACFAVLHAREYTRADRSASRQYQEANFGSVLFPTLVDIRDEVFVRSLTGQFTANHLSMVLIQPTTPNKGSIRDNRRINAREQAVQELLEKR